MAYTQLENIFEIILAVQKNFIPRILIIRGMTFEFEYLGEIRIYIRKYTRVEIRRPEVCFFYEKKEVQNLVQVYL